MRSKSFVFLGAALLGAAFAATSAVSQPAPDAKSEEKVCLQANRMMNYDVLDDHTLVITDRFFKRYTIRMASGCVGLTRATLDVVLQARQSLGCFGQSGDRVTFNSPGLGRLSCFVTSVENYAPPDAKQSQTN